MAENEDRYNQFLKQQGSSREKRSPSVLRLSREPSRDELAFNIREYNLLQQALSSHR
jgi:hypothetical protein